MAEGGEFKMEAHERTYGGFLSLIKYGTVAAGIVTAIVVLLIAS